MSYNGSGTFVINSSGQPVVTGTTISSTAFNALTADLGTGLSTAITKDGQTTTTSVINFAAGLSTPDNVFSVKDNVDSTKILQFQCSGITAGQTRTMTIPDASGTLVLAAGSGTGGNSLVLLSTGTAATSAVIDFTSGLTSTYDEYLFIITGLLPATDNAVLWMRVSEDGGSTFKAGATDYAYSAAQMSDSAVASVGSTGDTKMVISSGAALSATKGGYYGEVRLFAPSGTTQNKATNFHVSGQDTGAFKNLVGSGRFILDTNAINAVRFLMSTGNITSGTIAMYGVKKS